MDFPPELLPALPAGAAPVALTWWKSLPEAERVRVAALWDSRLEVSFFTPQADGTGCVDRWENVPTVKGGRFMPAEYDDRPEWEAGYFEHLLNHPELMLMYKPPLKTFHIGCTRHTSARECMMAGEVPLNFNCSAGDSLCPLESLRGARLISINGGSPVKLGRPGGRA